MKKKIIWLSMLPKRKQSKRLKVTQLWKRIRKKTHTKGYSDRYAKTER